MSSNLPNELNLKTLIDSNSNNKLYTDKFVIKLKTLLELLNFELYDFIIFDCQNISSSNEHKQKLKIKLQKILNDYINLIS